MEKKLIINSRKNSKNTIRLIFSIWEKLTKKRKKQFCLLILLMLISGLAELFSLAAVIPFLSVITDSETVWRIQFVRDLSNVFGIYQAQFLIIPLTIIFGLASALAAGIRLLNIWVNYKFAAAIGSDLSAKTYKLTLFQPYEIHIKRNSSKVITALSRQIDFTVYVLGFALQLITSSFIVFGLLLGLFLTNWQVALGAGFVIGGIYVIVIQKTKKLLLSNGRFIANSMQLQVKNLQEGLGGIRDVILDNSQNTFLNIYTNNDFARRSKEATNQYLQQFPKLILESISIIFIAVLGLILVSIIEDKSNVITILGTLALGAQRLLPASQQIYGSWVGIKSNAASVNDVLEMLNQKVLCEKFNKEDRLLQFSKEIQLKQINYSYDKKLVLKDINLKIKKGEVLGIVGRTGSGKSTLVDLIMGLLKPKQGFIEVDGKKINYQSFSNELIGLRKKISHIPQNIFLKDSNVLENIAFGSEVKNIDFAKVKGAAKIARIHEFIIEELGGYNAYVGEKGIKLSGGQLQRIGIARALYKESEILVMDEATSSLDEYTEKQIIKSIYSLENRPTIIMIAHRLSTLKNCDRIIHMSLGKIKDCGKPTEILPKISEDIII
tara:strand:- start:437 stop:2260 length:1824 start_codon:yes stop_codon:yes gene_type:complete